MKSKIKKGDQVVVITGRDKGQTGQVLSVQPADQRVTVQGINMVTRHRRATQTNPGGIERMEASIHISNVALIDPESNKPARVGYAIEDGKKRKIANSIGICSSIGTHPARGFTPAFLYRSIVACCFFIGSLESLNFSVI